MKKKFNKKMILVGLIFIVGIIVIGNDSKGKTFNYTKEFSNSLLNVSNMENSPQVLLIEDTTDGTTDRTDGETVTVESKKYTVDKDYIYVGYEEIDLDNIVVTGGIPFVNGDVLEIKSGDTVVYSYDIIRIIFNDLVVGDNYVYTGVDGLNLSDFECVNCNVSFKDNDLIVETVDKVQLDRYKILSITTDYVVYKGTMYAGKDYVVDDDTIPDLIDCSVGVEVVDGTLKITSLGSTGSCPTDEDYVNSSGAVKEIVDAVNQYYNKCSVLTDDTDTDNTCVFIGDASVDGEIDILDNTRITRYAANQLTYDEYDLILSDLNEDGLLDGTDVSMVMKYIVGNKTEAGVAGTFPSKFKLDVSYLVEVGLLKNKYSDNDQKIINNIKSELCDIYLKGDKVLVKYADEVIYEYQLSSESVYVDIDDSLNVMEEKRIISRVPEGTTVEQLLGMINTNGKESVLSNSNVITSGVVKTGDTVKIVFDDSTLEYTISVIGDVNSDGILSQIDVDSVVKHITGTELISIEAELLAADYNNDGNIKMNDVMMMMRDIKGEE